MTNQTSGGDYKRVYQVVTVIPRTEQPFDWIGIAQFWCASFWTQYIRFCYKLFIFCHLSSLQLRAI